MALQDPTNEPVPDFEHEDWAATIEALTSQGKSMEEAVGVLKKAWELQHKRRMDEWNDRLRLQDQDRPLDERASIPPELPSTPPEEESNWDAVPTPNFLDIRPAHHILKRLEKKEFVDLWHFTAQGCREAATLELTAPENAFSFINTEKGPMLQPAGAASISSSKVTRDEALSYDQWSEGKNRLLNCMAEHG